jgi:SAM-dependent methyltransferase
VTKPEDVLPPVLPFSPAAERNREAILAVLAGWLAPQAAVLEVASGTGQHAEHFCGARPGWQWQPTEAEPAALPAIAARCARQPGVAAPLPLDVLAAEADTEAWPRRPGGWDAVFCANLIHIAPWPVAPALLQGAARVLAPGGCLVLYGPYRVDGEPLSPGNQAFDADLRDRNPAWGLRRLSAVQEAGQAAGLAFVERVDMPANNLMLRWRLA